MGAPLKNIGSFHVPGTFTLTTTRQNSALRGIPTIIKKKKKTLFYGREKTGRRPCFYGRHFRFQQQPRVRVGDPRPRRPRIAAVPDHGPGHAAVGAGAVRRAAGQPVQRGRVGGGARPVGQQDDRGLPATDARTRGPVTGVGRYQLPGARPLVAVGAAR